ncbi:MAG: transglutaminase family protein [Leptolyngbyaceae cyanobacterium CSU_1_3]|nr:transglutaminase family protein [Leptolyngbyaceae cyanobacterium CSU_1_3]
MRLNAGCDLVYTASTPTPLILMLRPRSGLGQWVFHEDYQLEPNVPIAEYTDGYGNLCQRLVAPPGIFHIRTSFGVETAATIDVLPGAPYISAENLPDPVIQFLLPSRYCESDKLGNLASKIVENYTPGYDQVEAIRSWIHQNIKYEYGTSDASTSATETATKQVGVCRDFTHLGISLCRSLNIPARMVVGYLYQLDPMDLHAWFEAFVGDRWYIFDATQKEAKGNRIAIAYGRDATDVALATQFGAIELNEMRVWVNESTAS